MEKMHTVQKHGETASKGPFDRKKQGWKKAGKEGGKKTSNERKEGRKASKQESLPALLMFKRSTWHSAQDKPTCGVSTPAAPSSSSDAVAS